METIQLPVEANVQRLSADESKALADLLESRGCPICGNSPCSCRNKPN